MYVQLYLKETSKFEVFVQILNLAEVKFGLILTNNLRKQPFFWRLQSPNTVINQFRNLKFQILIFFVANCGPSPLGSRWYATTGNIRKILISGVWDLNWYFKLVGQVPTYLNSTSCGVYDEKVHHILPPVIEEFQIFFVKITLGN